MSTVIPGSATWHVRSFWFPGFTYNATLASRTALSSVANDTIKNGYVFCYDPEAYDDCLPSPKPAATLPTGMILKGAGTLLSSGTPATAANASPLGDGGWCRNVCKPTTGVLSNFAGVLVNAPPEGYRPDKGFADGGYQGGRWIDLCFAGESVPTMVNGDVAGATPAAFEALLMPVTGQWYLSPVAVGTNGANLPAICGRPNESLNFSSTTKVRCRLGPFGHPTSF